jgi:hypothetical protein
MTENENETEATQAETPEPQEQEQEQEQAAQQEAQPEEAEAQGEDGEPAQEEDEAAPESEAEKPTEKHRRAGGWQRKVERLEREKQFLMQQLQGQVQQQTQPAPAKEKTPDEKAAEYVNHLVEQQLAAREAQRQQEAQRAEFQRRQDAARAAHADYDDVLESSTMPVSQALQQVLLTSEQGPAIMYQLAKNPAELARLSALPPLDAAREIGRLEARASSTASPKTTKSATRPPAPPNSINGNTSSSTRRLEELSIADYKKAYRTGRR